MAFLVPDPGTDGRGTTQYKAVDENGKVLARGKLEIDPLVPGGTRHGNIVFVTTDAEGDQRPEKKAGLGSLLGGGA